MPLCAHSMQHAAVILFYMFFMQQKIGLKYIFLYSWNFHLRLRPGKFRTFCRVFQTLTLSFLILSILCLSFFISLCQDRLAVLYSNMRRIFFCFFSLLVLLSFTTSSTSSSFCHKTFPETCLELFHMKLKHFSSFFSRDAWCTFHVTVISLFLFFFLVREYRQVV